MPDLEAKIEEPEEERSLLSTFNVKLAVYEGPFDLMLAMVDKGELDLYNVSLTAITQGFLDYLKEMSKMNVAVAGEFLLMAAYLLEMKSRKLLPVAPTTAEEESLVDVEQELLERLAEYKIYKNLAQSLKDRKEVFQRVYTRYAPQEAIEDQEIFLVDVSMRDLVSAFKRVWDMAEAKETTQEIVAENFSVKDKIIEIEEKLAASSNGVSFNSLFTRYIKTEIIVTFLAILELMKRKAIKIMQSDTFGEIFIFRSEAAQ
jgi:segregation and condensation protein A